MKNIRITTNKSGQPKLPKGRINTKLFDATTEEEIAEQQAIDDAEAQLDAAKFAKKVRLRIGLSQSEFSKKIDVSIETIRNWEQGKRTPTGAAKALLKILNQSPELALSALN